MARLVISHPARTGGDVHRKLAREDDALVRLGPGGARRRAQKSSHAGRYLHKPPRVEGSGDQQVDEPDYRRVCIDVGVG